MIAPAKGHTHTLKKMSAVSATCLKEGTKEHYVCTGCSKLFSDEKAVNEITKMSALVIPAVGHTESGWKSDENAHWKVCAAANCDVVIDGSKAAHVDKNGDEKCDTCLASVKAPVATTTAATTASGENKVPAEERHEGMSQTELILLIALIAVSVILLIGIAVVVTVLIMKKKGK